MRLCVGGLSCDLKASLNPPFRFTFADPTAFIPHVLFNTSAFALSFAVAVAVAFDLEMDVVLCLVATLVVTIHKE